MLMHLDIEALGHCRAETLVHCEILTDTDAPGQCCLKVLGHVSSRHPRACHLFTSRQVTGPCSLRHDLTLRRLDCLRNGQSDGALGEFG